MGKGVVSAAAQVAKTHQISASVAVQPSAAEPSWKDKVSQPKLNRKGMALLFVAPIIDNANVVPQLDSFALEELASVWDRSIILYVGCDKPS